MFDKLQVHTPHDIDAGHGVPVIDLVGLIEQIVPGQVDVQEAGDLIADPDPQ